MNKVQYLSQLDGLLKGLAEPERREALEFYYGYFEDGMENGKTEQQIVEELGTPREAAEKIFAAAGTRREENCPDGGDSGGYGPCRGAGAAVPRRQENGDRVWKIVGIVLLCVFFGPPALGVGVGLLGAVFGILAALAAVLVAVPAALLFAAFVCIAAAGSVGISAVGWFLLLLGLGVLAAALSCLVVWQLARLIRFLSRTIGEEIRLHRREKTEGEGGRR